MSLDIWKNRTFVSFRSDSIIFPSSQPALLDISIEMNVSRIFLDYNYGNNII